MSYKKASYFALAFLVLLAAGYLWTASGLRDPRTRGSIGPGYFPFILSVLLIFLCGLSFVQTLRRPEDETLTVPNLGYVLAGIGAIAAFITLWAFLSVFYPLVYIFVAGLMLLFQPNFELRRLAIILVTSLVLTFMIYGLFELVMGVRF
ncbi:tripartite tricarboxylate transporter TctB family protein [Marivita sp.]|uniref:tripartite tricarboxylate transporter TctB family protein n=1 Tax=Marivita sp. TaxID=2003365 RepID=UPI003F6EE072